MAFNCFSHRLIREFCAECLGTFVLITVSLMAIAQRVLGGDAFGSQATISLATGMGVTMGVYSSGGVSGGHINPSVTIAMAALGRLPWLKVPVYILGQFIGSFVASVFVYLIYMDALNHFDGGERQLIGEKGTGAIWATYPQPYVSTWSGLGDQVFSTCFLLLCVMAISDRRNMGPPPGLAPISLGFVVMITNMTLAMNCGNAMNPARDLAPRIFTALAGWGAEPFRNYNWWWVPVVGPVIGALIGAAIYQGLVGHHWSHDDNAEPPPHQAQSPLLEIAEGITGDSDIENGKKRQENKDSSTHTVKESESHKL